MPATTAQIQQHADALTALLQDGCLHIYDPGVSPDTPSALTAEMSFTTGDDPLTDSRRRQALDGFAKRAMKAIVKYLAKRGTASGEQLVAMLKQNGIFPEWGDDRAYGSVFRQVRTDPTCPIYVIRADLPRRRGHGTSGGKLYGLTRQREQH